MEKGQARHQNIMSVRQRYLPRLDIYQHAMNICGGCGTLRELDHLRSDLAPLVCEGDGLKCDVHIGSMLLHCNPVEGTSQKSHCVVESGSSQEGQGRGSGELLRVSGAENGDDKLFCK